MKKYICLLLVMALCFGVVGCGDTQQTQSAETGEPASDNQTVESGGESETNYVFRYANWGDDIETVAKREPNKYNYIDSSSLTYSNIVLSSYNTDVHYLFNENGFSGGWYEINETQDSLALYEGDFDYMDSFLKEQYGSPKLKKESKWKKAALEADESLSQFDVIYYSLWKEKNVHILHMLHKYNSKIKHSIMCINPTKTKD